MEIFGKANARYFVIPAKGGIPRRSKKSLDPRVRRDDILIILFVCLAALAGCSLPKTNFSQYPGFAEYYSAHPPRDVLPSAAEQVLLARYRPRFFLPPNHAGLIDFYRDYIAQGRLVDGNAKLISIAVTPEILNAHKEDPAIVFIHLPNKQAATQATVFGRIDYDELQLAGAKYPLTFLTYHAVFRHSGIAAGFAGWRANFVALFTDLNDWHQLDHYTAATVVLNAAAQPIALMLQQHNYHHTYVFDREFSVSADGRVNVDISIRSNELYPHSAQKRRHRAVRFNSPQEMRYLLGFGDKPRIAEDDISEGRYEAEYHLVYLRPSDAFYTFKGFLGERRRLPGRDGPPGADFNALPETKALTSQMLMGFWREGNRDDLNRLEATYAKSGKAIDFVRAQTPIFLDALRHVK
jgi:hypothetical protein